MTRLFPRGPSMWAFPVRLVRCPEKTLPSPSCRIYIWQLCSGSRVWEEAGVQILNPLIFLESHCFQHSDLQYRDSPCISSSKTIVYCLWKLNLFCHLLQEEGVKSPRGMGKVGVEARELYLLLHLFPPTLLLRPHPYFHFQTHQEHSSCPGPPSPSHSGGPPTACLQAALSTLSASLVISPSQVLLFSPFHPHCFCVSGFQEEKEPSICVQLASFNSKAFPVLSPACSGGIFNP